MFKELGARPFTLYLPKLTEVVSVRNSMSQRLSPTIRLVGREHGVKFIMLGCRQAESAKAICGDIEKNRMFYGAWIKRVK